MDFIGIFAGAFIALFLTNIAEREKRIEFDKQINKLRAPIFQEYKSILYEMYESVKNSAYDFFKSATTELQLNIRQKFGLENGYSLYDVFFVDGWEFNIESRFTKYIMFINAVVLTSNCQNQSMIQTTQALEQCTEKCKAVFKKLTALNNENENMVFNEKELELFRNLQCDALIWLKPTRWHGITNGTNEGMKVLFKDVLYLSALRVQVIYECVNNQYDNYKKLIAFETVKKISELNDTKHVWGISCFIERGEFYFKLKGKRENKKHFFKKRFDNKVKKFLLKYQEKAKKDCATLPKIDINEIFTDAKNYLNDLPTVKN